MYLVELGVEEEDGIEVGAKMRGMCLVPRGESWISWRLGGEFLPVMEIWGDMQMAVEDGHWVHRALEHQPGSHSTDSCWYSGPHACSLSKEILGKASKDC